MFDRLTFNLVFCAIYDIFVIIFNIVVLLLLFSNDILDSR